MNFPKLGKMALAAAAVVACVGSATAAPISVGFNFIPFGGVLTANTGDITTSSSVSYSGGGYVINTIDATTTTNNVGVLLFGGVNLTDPMPLSVGSVFTKEFTTGLGSFTESLTVDAVTSGPTSRSISASGTITGGGFDPTPVFFSGTYTQNNGPTGQINAAFNNSTTPPPPNRTPEPGSLALVGAAIVGLAMVRRRRV